MTRRPSIRERLAALVRRLRPAESPALTDDDVRRNAAPLSHAIGAIGGDPPRSTMER